jgi:hypothetical protein
MGMAELGIPELMIIGVVGVLVAAVALGFGWMIFGRKRSR